jgi:hypothetical protein
MLKEWGKPVGGNKAELLARVLDEVEGATAHCPVSRAVRAQVLHLQTGRMTQCKAKVRLGAARRLWRARLDLPQRPPGRPAPGRHPRRRQLSPTYRHC